MHYLNEEIDLRDEFPFFFVIDKDLLIKDFGEGYKKHLLLNIGHSADLYFNLPWEKVKNTFEIDKQHFNQRISLTDSQGIAYKAKVYKR